MQSKIVITGGAGFIGSNLAEQLLRDGKHVTILDNLSRTGSALNLEWLFSQYGQNRLSFINADVRDYDAVSTILHDAGIIYHLAAQVAVTTSMKNPREDFDVNALGTLNVLEAARKSKFNPIILFTSTNKVYGEMTNLKVIESPSRYELPARPYGIDEAQALDFYSPYGCSKGTADQYTRDYARIYGLRTIVFRLSCIYGPRQFGNEDQGWLAHMLIAARLGRSITIYGDGKQVRDVLFIDDLVRAMKLATEKLGRAAGQVYNIGGGISQTLSVWCEFGALMRQLNGNAIKQVKYDDWRCGDQRYYVSDIRKAEQEIGWRPNIGLSKGTRKLWDWICKHEQLIIRSSSTV